MALDREFTFRSSNLPERSFKLFADMRKENKFCDIELIIGTQRISAHRVILAAAIPLFRDTLSSEEEIPVLDIEPTVFESLVKYAYHNELKITMDNVKGLLSGSCVMQMKDVQDACCDFLLQRLQPQNVLSFRGLANDLNLPELKECVDLYIKENFEEVSRTEEFLNSSFTYVREVIGQDDLNVDGEEKVLGSVLRWVKASIDERESNLPELLQHVRMVLLEPLYLTDLVEGEEFIRMSLASRDLVDEARNYNLFPERRKKKCSFATKPRQFMQVLKEDQETDNKLYCLISDLKYTVLQFDPISETYSTKWTDEYWINDGSVTALNRKIYFFHSDCSFEYDTESNTGQLLTSFIPNRYTAAVSLRNKLYFCGGQTRDFVASHVVECFDPEKDEWREVNSLLTARWGLSAVCLGDYIYALGGKDDYNILDSVERYSSVVGKWQYMSEMLTPRAHGGAAVLNGKIYVCGGNTSHFGSDCMATAEMYDPITNKWEFISSMNTARSDLTLVAFSGKLYVIGGYDGDDQLLTFSEVYDSLSDGWKHGPTTHGCDHISAAVVTFLDATFEMNDGETVDTSMTKCSW